jgi:hypothetical protein
LVAVAELVDENRLAFPEKRFAALRTAARDALIRGADHSLAGRHRLVHGS